MVVCSAYGCEVAVCLDPVSADTLGYGQQALRELVK